MALMTVVNVCTLEHGVAASAHKSFTPCMGAHVKEHIIPAGRSSAALPASKGPLTDVPLLMSIPCFCVLEASVAELTELPLVAAVIVHMFA